MNETKLEMLSSHIVLNVLNKVREYYGRDDRVSNQFTQELENDTKEIILKYFQNEPNH